MPRATDGTPFHSFSRAKHHDSMQSEKKSKPAVEKPAAKEDGEKPEHEASQENIHDVVKEHGPAHHVEYEHDEATGKHHVHTKHGEAEHEHHSEHESSEDAMAHMHAAVGHEEPDEDDEEAEGEEYGEEMPAMEQGSHHIPGMG